MPGGGERHRVRAWIAKHARIGGDLAFADCDDRVVGGHTRRLVYDGDGKGFDGDVPRCIGGGNRYSRGSNWEEPRSGAADDDRIRIDEIDRSWSGEGDDGAARRV